MLMKKVKKIMGTNFTATVWKRTVRMFITKFSEDSTKSIPKPNNILHKI